MKRRRITKKIAIDRDEGKGLTVLVCAALIVLVSVVFWQTYNSEFLHYDDSEYVVENVHIQGGFTAENIGWAFTSGYASNWHPVTWLSHMLDWRLFGTNAGGHHIVNVVLHLINSLLVFLIFKRMTKNFWPSAFVAGLFAIHPGHVESVAWVSERKDVLSSMFWLLTMWAYLRYVEKRSVKWYLVTAVSFAVGLMAKPMLVTLPFVLLLLDHWPLGRIEKFSWQDLRGLVLEKIPLFLLAAGSSIVTFLVQQKAGSMVGVKSIALSVRIVNSILSYAKYIGIMIWPTNLRIFYPSVWDKESVVYKIAGTVLLVGITIFVLWFGRRYKYLLVGWLWYIGTLVPVIGLVQVGMQTIADRYTYMPFIGLFIMVAWGIGDLSAKLPHRKPVMAALASGVILVLAACSWVQAGYWHDSIVLFERTLKVAKNNGRIYNNLNVIYYNLGTAYYRAGQTDKAMACWLDTVRLYPDNNEAHNNLGAVYYQKGQVDLAIRHFQQALAIDPCDLKARENLDLAMSEKEKNKE